MLRVNNLIGFGKRSSAGAGGIANAVSYNGTNAYLSRASDFIGDVDSSQGLISFWLRLDAAPGSGDAILSNTTGHSRFLNSTAGKISVDCINAAGTKSFNFQMNTGFITLGVWRNILASWDTNFGAGLKLSHLYTNGVSNKAVTFDADTAFNVDYTDTGWTVAALSGGANLLHASISEMFYAPGHYLDFSISANRDLFYNSATGKTANAGNLPSAVGFTPLVYLTNPASTVNVNSGGGGNFVINGTPTVASTSPSD